MKTTYYLIQYKPGNHSPQEVYFLGLVDTESTKKACQLRFKSLKKMGNDQVFFIIKRKPGELSWG